MFMKRIGEKRRLRNLVAAVSVGLIAGAFSILPVTEARGGVELPVLDAKGAAVTIEPTSEPGWDISSTADNNIIKWVSFSIGSGGKVAFDSHNYLNYVTGHARSDILGTLTGGGSIYIVNPNGILIGDGAQVDVGSLYLSTRNLTTEQLAGFDTAAGALFKTDSLSGDVINMGKLNADVISVEGNNITFKNTAEVTKDATLDNEGQLTGGTVNQAVNLWADGGEIHIGSAVGAEATTVNNDQYTNITLSKPTGWTINKTANEAMYMLVRNPYELQNMRNKLSGNYMLAGNIDANSISEFVPIGRNFSDDNLSESAFTGRFDGLNYKVSNLHLSVNNPHASRAGLFGVNAGTIENLEVGGAIEVNNSTGFFLQNIGAVAGSNTGTVRNVRNTGDIDYSTAEYGVNYFGGIVGANNGGTIKNAYNTGTLKADSDKNVTVFFFGGIVGDNHDGVIANVYNSGTLEDVSTVSTKNSLLGGIVGYNSGNMASVTNAYNSGTLTAKKTSNNKMGGIAGANYATISKTYNSGELNGQNEVGGIRGNQRDDNTDITDSYSTYAKDGRASNDARDGILLTDDNKALKNTYSGFDFSANGAWRIYEGKTMPLLTAFLTRKDNIMESVYDGTKGDVGVHKTASAQTSTQEAGIDWVHDVAIVTPKTLTVTGNIDKVYDGTTAVTLTADYLSGVVEGETLTVSTTSANYDDKNAGTNKTVTYEGLTLGGTKAKNYTIDADGTTTGTISAKEITATFADISKTYDGNTTATAGAGILVGVETIDNGKVSVTANAAYADKNAGTGKTVNYTGVALSGEEAGNYTIANTATGQGAIAAKSITATFADISKTYDGTTNATAGSGTLVGVEDIDNGKVSVTANAVYADKNAGTGKTVNYTGVALSGDEAGNYTIAETATGQGTINQKEAQVTFNPITKVYDGTTDATPGAATIFGLINADKGNVGVTADAAYEDKNVGTGKRVAYTNIALTGTEAQNYRLTQTSVDADTGTITRKSITATFADISKTYDGSTTATAGAGTLAGVETIDNGKVSVTANAAYADKNAGTGKTVNYTGVALSGEEAGNYTIANTATGQGAIAAKSITATFADISKTYDGTNTATAGAGTLNGVEAVDTGKVSVTASAAYADKNVGTGKQVDYTNVALTGDEAGNYTIASTATGNGTIAAKNITVSFADISKTYDGTTDAAAGTGTLQGVVSGDDITLQDGIAAVYDSKNAGNRTVNYSGIAIGGADVGNYTIAATGTGTGVINPKELTASFADVSKTYDGTTSAVAGAGTLDGVVAVDTGKVSVTANAAYADKNAGTSKQVDYTNVTLTGDEAANYAIVSTATGNGQIDRANLTVSVKDYSREYDGTTSASGAELQVTSGTLYAGDSMSGGTKVFDTKNAGNGKTITVSEVTVKDSTGNANNYNISYAANTNSVITPKNLTINFTDISKTYDGTTNATAGAGTLQGVVAGEDVTLQDGIAAVYDSKNAGNRTVNYSGIAISGADIGNYTIAATGTGTGVINPKELTASFADISKTYDGTITAMAGEGTLTGVENVDTGKVGVTASAAYVDKNAGTNKQVDYTNVALTGTEAGNYTIANTAIGKGQINRANLTISVKDYSREYDGATSANGAELQVTSGTLYAGDTISGGTKVFDTKDVGTGKNITVSEVTVSDSAGNANNYNISYVANTNSVISPKTLTVNFADISKTYDGTTSATAGAGTLNGVEDIDSGKVSVSASAAYADKNAGTNKQVDYTNVTLGGDEAGNYIIAAVATGTGVIIPKAITATFADISKTYDGTTSATAGAGTLNGVEAVDTGKVSVSASAAYADKNAGTDKQVDYSNVTLTGDEAGNYSIANTATGKGQIDCANLTVSVKDYSREYDGTVNADGAELSVTSGTLYVGDTISGGTKVFDTKDVGTGKTITISGVSINDGNNGDNYAVTYQPNTNSAITALPQSEPENPQPSQPEPGKPEPVNPEPSNPEPSNPEPVNPEPSNPEPVNTDPSQEQQLAETGNTVADIESATEKLGAEEVNEMKEKMVAPKHEALEVTDEKSGDDENEKKQSKK